MIALLWNCRDLGQVATIRSLREYVNSHRPGLIFLSELKISNLSRTHKIAQTLGFVNNHLIPSHGHSGGLLLLWKQSYQIQMNVEFNFLINCLVTEITHEGPANWQLTLIYGPTIPSLNLYSGKI